MGSFNYVPKSFEDMEESMGNEESVDSISEEKTDAPEGDVTTVEGEA